jgi:hypothetical protein
MLLRFSYLFILIALAIGAFFYVYFTRQDDRTPLHVGVERCRVCHEPASAGAQFGIWRSGPHSRAFTALQSDTARTIIASTKEGIDACLPCHTTLGRGAHNRFEQELNAEGVGCERCHGPGSKYAYYNVMRDSTAFLTSGGVTGSLRDCRQCHTDDLATTPAHRTLRLASFDADSAWARIRHNVPPKPTQPDTVIQLRNP